MEPDDRGDSGADGQQEATVRDAPGPIVEHAIPALFRFRGIFSAAFVRRVIVLTVLVILIQAPVLAAFGGNPPAALNVASYAVFGAAVGLFVWRLQKRIGRETKKKVTAHTGDIVELLKTVIPAHGDPFGSFRVRTLAESLAAAGRTGLTARLCPAEMATPIVPLDVTFEPRPLELAHLGFESLTGVGSAAARSWASRPAADPNNELTVFRRSFRLKGGWLMVALFGFLVLTSGLEAYQRRRLTFQFVVASAGFVVLLFMPIRGGVGKRAGQCLVVPGGLIFRHSRWRDEHWSVHLFVPRRSVLLVYRVMRHQWGLSVSDGSHTHFAVGTREEMEFVLRAWTSPLPPPEEALVQALA